MNENNEQKVYDLRKVPNEIIIAAYNEACDYYEFGDNCGRDEFAKIINPNFDVWYNKECEKIAQNVKEALYRYTIEQDGANDEQERIKKFIGRISADNRTRVETLDETRGYRQKFLNIIEDWKSLIAKNLDNFKAGMPIIKDCDDNDTEYSIIVLRGNAIVIPKREGCDGGFVAYNEHLNKTEMDALIEGLYAENEAQGESATLLSEDENE